MEESGQRSAYPEYIDEARLRTRKRIFWETLISLGFTGVVLYLLGFFITALLWVYGYQLIHREIFLMGSQELLRLFRNASWLTTIVVLATICWSYYNYLIFRIRGERRGNQIKVCLDKDLADFFNIEVEVLEKVKTHPCVNITNEEDSIIFK